MPSEARSRRATACCRASVSAVRAAAWPPSCPLSNPLSDTSSPASDDDVARLSGRPRRPRRLGAVFCVTSLMHRGYAGNAVLASRSLLSNQQDRCVTGDGRKPRPRAQAGDAPARRGSPHARKTLRGRSSALDLEDRALGIACRFRNAQFEGSGTDRNKADLGFALTIEFE